ncbi:hypothetical protein [Acidiphilium sp.]|uniref:hypothetical protein n=1 Tax=Acidiphilium sp. TaxID=527 RepID=UPI003D020E27
MADTSKPERRGRCATLLIEPGWRDLKAHHLAHQIFVNAAAFDETHHEVVGSLNLDGHPSRVCKG